MKIKCEYCGSMIDDNNEKCPNCGATNINIKRTANFTPQTIKQLKEWYNAHNLPSEEITRFFIGKNYTKPCAFGIYKEGDEFIVYKNKDTGQRVIRYRGTDEAYAVNELYLKLKSEILNQKSHKNKINTDNTSSTSGLSTLSNFLRFLFFCLSYWQHAYGQFNFTWYFWFNLNNKPFQYFCYNLH